MSRLFVNQLKVHLQITRQIFYPHYTYGYAKVTAELSKHVMGLLSHCYQNITILLH